ncbi:hypothetical protein HPY228_02505 [Helicobacter pylori]|nr:hypothetical protein HPY228_02505 [Helicobacter pylori]
MIFSHRSLLDKLYPLISSEKLGGEALFYPNLKKTIFIKAANHSFKVASKNFTSNKKHFTLKETP